MRRISGKILGENEKKYFMLNTFFPEHHSWDNYDKNNIARHVIDNRI
jgi:hypothetical protein